MADKPVHAGDCTSLAGLVSSDHTNVDKAARSRGFTWNAGRK